MGEENKGKFQLMINGIEINNISELSFDVDSIDSDSDNEEYYEQLRHFVSSIMNSSEFTMTGMFNYYTINKTTRKVFHLWKCGKSKRIKKKNQKRYFNIAI